MRTVLNLPRVCETHPVTVVGISYIIICTAHRYRKGEV